MGNNGREMVRYLFFDSVSGSGSGSRQDHGVCWLNQCQTKQVL